MASEIGISVQTIYRVLNKVKQDTDDCLTEKINGISHITIKGEEVIKERLSNVKHSLNYISSEFNAVKHYENEEITFLREQNKILQDELITERAHSREQADKLSDLATQLAELARNNQVLLGAEQSRTNLALMMNSENDSEHPKKGFFKKLFQKKDD